MRKPVLILLAVFTFDQLCAQIKDSLAQNKLEDTLLLKAITVTAKKPVVQILPDKTIINVDASISNAGSTLLEVLEKSPGIATDRHGNITLKGRQGVLILVDGKPVQLSGADLNAFLNGIPSAQIDQIEIMDHPPAKYDAAGNAGVINIKTKKNKQKGLNGNLSVAAGQGRYTRNINTVGLNYNAGKINFFANAGFTLNNNFTQLNAFRKYYAVDEKTITALLEQPSFFKGSAPSENIKAGFDYTLNKKTTIGAVLYGNGFTRTTNGDNTAIWMNPAGMTDSTIYTRSERKDNMLNGAFNINARHTFSNNRELTADADYLGYRIGNKQFFNNQSDADGGYTEDLNGNIPSVIRIFTAKADYSQHVGKASRLEAGWKSSHVNTDNKAEYSLRYNGGNWLPDYGKTNHFLYKENIHAAYASLRSTLKKWTLQGGIRYEYIRYDAQQLGNIMRKDSSFSRMYDGLFPSLNASIQLDSIHTLSLNAGRRIDRPAFQKLNPFVFVINKYTYQSGNPFFRPQYSWNIEVGYTYKSRASASIGYTIIKDYFSQIFYSDSSGIITYTEGNLDNMQNIGLSVTGQHAPFNWWSFSGEVYFNYKKIRGFVWKAQSASLTQMSLNLNNQFDFGKGWGGEISGFFTLKDQELQEITDPTGQLTIGISKQILKNRGTIKLLGRDIFYTQAMKGNTVFKQATEYFSIYRDTRAASVAFTYRFGKSSKSLPARSGGADEERSRVNTTS